MITNFDYLYFKKKFNASIITKLTSISFHLNKITGPKSEIVSEQLHYSGRVSVLFFLESLQIGDCEVESIFGKLASLIRRVQYFVMEY